MSKDCANTSEPFGYNDHRTSNIIIQFNDEGDSDDIFAHKEILIAGSKYFQRVFQKAPTFKVLRMSSDNQQAAQDMIRHLYSLNPRPIRHRNVLHDIELWIIAHDYEVSSLIKTSEVTIADRLGSKTPLRGISHFTDVLRAIYKAPELGGELRKTAVQACKDGIEYLMSQHKFRKMLMEIPEMAVDLLNEMAKPQQERGRLMRVQRSIS